MINKEHPKYNEFMRKFEGIKAEYPSLMNDTLPKGQFDIVHKEFATKISKLQHEYEFLWPGGLK